MGGCIIGLTGPTGAGKSEAARALAEAGCVVVDADRVSRLAVAEPDCLAALAEAFGADILLPDGTLNRRELARRAFATHEKERLLNAITHPRILKYMNTEIQTALDNGAQAVIVDAPLLFESGMDAACQVTAAVLAPAEVRLQRICARDHLSEADAKLRMKIQPPDDFYVGRASKIFYNDRTPEALRVQVTRWLGDILQKGAE
ncbi:MAG: dephospho-CoA kinase [Clostridia bacterium]|nr:dephospho-CoA kinase [Clostridia bacterium]